ncbi:MAG: hypothetical protein O9308_16490 [Beijerinckiaceae bacterium]|nr:hypothetical protein [Beijerinckiaceae bacterium]
MPAYVIFDMQIDDSARYQESTAGVQPALEAWESFYEGPVYQGLKVVRDACSSARLVGVAGLD